MNFKERICIQAHISARCLNQKGTRCSTANPANAQLSPLRPLPCSQSRLLLLLIQPLRDGLAQTVQDVFSCSAFVTLPSQLPTLVTDNCVFEVQIQRVQALLLSERVRARCINPAVLINLLSGGSKKKNRGFIS